MGPIIIGDVPETMANAQFFQQMGLAMGYILFSVLEFESKILVDLAVLVCAFSIFCKSDIVRKNMNHKECINIVDTVQKMDKHVESVPVPMPMETPKMLMNMKN